MTTHQSTCCYCGVGCGVVVKQAPGGQLTLEGDKEHPSNRGMLCSKGMNLHYTVMDQSDRLLYPQMRFSRDRPMQRVSWDAALERTAAVFKTFINKYGPDSVAFYVSGQCLTEEYYLVSKLIKGFIGSNNVDTNSRLCMSSAVVGYKLSLGEDTVPVCYDDIEEADLFLVQGANPAWCHPIIWRRIEAHKAANPHVRIICVDPRRTDTARSADLHLPVRPGTDIVLNHAIARQLIDSDLIDTDFLANHTDGFAALRERVMERTVHEAAEICGVDAADIRQTAEWIGESKGFLSLWTMGLNQSVVGVNKNLSLINLHLLTGRIGTPGNGPFSLTGQPNAMGGREVGGLANALPAHRDVTNAVHRAEMETFWNTPVRIADKPGLTATELVNALNDDKLKAIWIINTNPVVSMPDVNAAERALRNARFVVVQDVSARADTVAFADVVLPAAGWLEKEGTMTNAERRITYLPKVVDAPGEALPDVEIIWRFAQKMGFGDQFTYENAEAVYAEYARSTTGTNPDVSGVTYALLRERRSVQWPYKQVQSSMYNRTGGPVQGLIFSDGGTLDQTEGQNTQTLDLNPWTSDSPERGTIRLFTDHRFYTPNGRAQLHAVPDANASEPTDVDFPLVLTTGRIRDQWHTMTKTGRVTKLNQHAPLPKLDIHPDDARARLIREGQLVSVTGRRGEVRVTAHLTDDVRPGLCFLPMHWGRALIGDKDSSTLGRANNLTNALVDPRSKEPDFKFTAVEVVPYQKPAEKIIIVGAGSAGLGFINAYRNLKSDATPATDEIHVFSSEIYPFYNRVLLPDYISGAQTWEQLVKLREDQFAEANILVHKGVSIAHIDRRNKVVTDSAGNEHTYDRLFLGMGSRAFMPKGVPRLPGIFNMRSRLDADALMPFLRPDDDTEPHTVIVGGGLLGLELAASLRQLGIRVSVVQRISRFMERQLDPVAGDLLYQDLIERGIEVYFNEEVQTFVGTDRVTGVRLKSGRTLTCQVVVMAIGTVPNTELARAAGLTCNRGVVINDYGQTSDPDIFAAGELAQWQGKMWGITLAAEQQAEAAARFISGDVSQPYKGSVSMNILKMEGLHLCSIGIPESPANDPAYEEIIFIDKAKRYYKKCIVHRDKLVGAVLVGDKNEFQEFRDLIANGTELTEKRLQLLRASKPADPIAGKLVCSCNNVGQGNLERAIAAGCTDFQQLCQKTGAGTGCGSCRPEVRGILEKMSELVNE